MKTFPQCPYCGSNDVYSHGTINQSNKPRYRCQNCKKTFGGDKLNKGGRPKKRPKKCLLCDRPARAKGLCTKHYQQQRYKQKNST